MGGFGTWSTTSAYPDLFAAAIPICGGGDPGKADKIKDLPIWVFHGDADTVVKIEKSQVMVDALKKRKSKVKFTIYPGVGHDSWSKTYNNPEIYDWLLEHKRK
jgi:predicted peptidase